jgi:hypothetical protein
MIGVIPTTQRVTGWPFGDCVRSTYSAILEIPIEQIPLLDPGTSERLGQDQGDRERMWLATIGLDLLEIGVNPPDELSPEILACAPDVPHLMSGISPRGYGHRVVGIGGKVAWDPHPSRAGLVTVYSIGILVPSGTTL